MKKNIITSSLINALGTVIYVSLVSQLIINGNELFGQVQSSLSAIAFLLLFVVSAAITGYLVFGRPVLIYLNGEKKEAVKLLGFTVLWLLIATGITLIILVL